MTLYALIRTAGACALLCATLAVPAQAAPESVVPVPDLPLLPPAASVVQVLTQWPQVRAADAGIAAAQAHSQRLQAGPHEWSLKAALQRRSDAAGARFAEQELGLETALRWPGKAQADRQLGELGVRAGELARGDAWHEAARSLLTDWFDALREARTADLLAAQARLAVQQLEVVQKRVKAGEVARLDVLAAQADQARTDAAAAQAQARAQSLARTLARRYPGLPSLPPASAIGQALPDPLAPSVQDWVTRILADNHELELAEALAQQARQRAGRSALEQRADPTLGVRATRERNGQEQVLGVYVSLPLGGAGRQADVALALAEAGRAQQHLAQTRLAVETEAWRAATAAQESRATWQRLDAACESIQRSADLQARAYSLGETALTEVLQARRGALEAALVAETARLEALQSHARLLLDTHQLWAVAHD